MDKYRTLSANLSRSPKATLLFRVLFTPIKMLTILNVHTMA